MRPDPRVPHPTSDRGVPGRAKFLAAVVLVAVVGAVIGAVELVTPGNGWRLLTFWGMVIAAVYWPLAFRAMRHVYGDRRMETEQRIQVAKEAKYRRWFFRYFLPVLALALAIFGGIDSGPAWKASHGQGRPGWAVVDRQECTRTCSWTGTFHSDDGTVVRADVWIREPPKGVRIGDRIRAVDTDDRAAVYEASGASASQYWWMFTGLFVGGGLYLAWWLGSITGLWRALVRDGDNLI